MTEQRFDFDAPAPAPSRTDLVEAYLRARPGEWIDGLVFAAFAGQYAWRSRLSDCRRRGLTIANRQRRRADGSVISEYRYIPAGASTGQRTEAA